jgi:tellurite resistance protein TerC
MIEVSATFWIGFLILVLFLLSLDMFVFHKKGERVKVKKALWLSLFLEKKVRSSFLRHI